MQQFGNWKRSGGSRVALAPERLPRQLSPRPLRPPPPAYGSATLAPASPARRAPIPDARVTAFAPAASAGLRRESRSYACARARRYGVFALALALGLASGGAPAQVPALAFANWGTGEGLPSNIALDIAQTRDGYLWLASYEGIVRFDGVRFRVYTDADIPGLSLASFWRVVVDSAGVLWAASEQDGLLRYAGGRWSSFGTAHGLKSDKVTALLPDRGDVLWVGTRNGVSR